MTRARFVRALSVVTLALPAVLATTADAGRARWPQDLEQLRQTPYIAANQKRVSLEQAIVTVQRSIGGRVLDAREVGGQYRIKVLTRDGEVRVVYVDPGTGAMR